MQLKKFDGSKAPVTIKGVVWQFNNAQQQWSRAVLRLYSNDSQYWELTYRVDPQLPFCLRCLSGHVESLGLRPTEGQPTVAQFHCFSCELDYSVEVEPL